MRGSREVDDKSKGPRIDSGVGDGDATSYGLGVAEREEKDGREKNEKVELANDVVVGGER